MIQKISATTSDPAFRDSILPRARRACASGFHAAGCQQIGYLLAELAITIENRVAVRTRFRKCLGSVEDGLALLVAAKTLKPDIILLDISMPALNGIDAARRLRKLLPSAKLIFLAMHADADYVGEAFRAGAMGYLLKRAAASELKIAIREVVKGNHYVSPLVARNALELLMSSAKSEAKPSDRLTPRQREVLQLVAEGRSRKEIASILNIAIFNTCRQCMRQVNIAHTSVQKRTEVCFKLNRHSSWPLLIMLVRKQKDCSVRQR